MFPKNIYFAGGAFGCVYHLGVANALLEHKISELNVYGNSAGVFVGMLYILADGNMSKFYKLYMKCVASAKNNIAAAPFTLSSYALTHYHLVIFDYVHKRHPDAYLKCNGRLHVGVTTPAGFVWVNQFGSNADLFNTLLCSVNVPILCDYDAKLDGTICIDGGYGFDPTKDLPLDIITIGLSDVRYDLNGDIPLVFRVLPPPDCVCEFYYQKGCVDMNTRIQLRRRRNPNPSLKRLDHVLEDTLFGFETMMAIRVMQDPKTITYCCKDLERFRGNQGSPPPFR